MMRWFASLRVDIVICVIPFLPVGHPRTCLGTRDTLLPYLVGGIWNCRDEIEDILSSSFNVTSPVVTLSIALEYLCFKTLKLPHIIMGCFATSYYSFTLAKPGTSALRPSLARRFQ